MTFQPDELKLILMGLAMYKNRVKKLLKNTEEVKAGEKEVKKTFIDTEALINRISSETED